MVPTIRRLGGLALCALLTACPTAVTTPVANPGNTQDNVAVGSLVQLDGSKSDAGGRDVTYTWSFVSLPVGSHAQLNDVHSVTPSFVADVPGSFVVQLVVANAFLSSSPKSVTINVTQCGANAPATGTIASAAVPATASLGVGVLVQLSAPAAADADNAPPPGCNLGQTLTYAWSLISQPAGSVAQLNNAAALQPSFTPDIAGDYLARLFITDSTGRVSAPGDLKITIPDCGSNAPSVDSLSATPSAPGIGSTVQLNPTVSDRDNSGACNLAQTFSYRWTALQLPANSHTQLNNATATNPSFVPDIAGDYVFRLVATDSTGRASLPKDIKVTATACGGNAPVAGFAFAPASPGIGTAVQLTAAPTDADNSGSCNLGQTFSYAWSIASLPSGSRASLNNPTSSNPTLVPDVAGDYLVQLVVTDSTGLTSAPLVKTITSTACGSATPSVTALTPPATAPNPGAAVTVSSTAASNEPTGCPAVALGYRWTLSRPSGSGAFLKDPGDVAANFTTDVAGTYQVSLVVTAPNGKSSAPRFQTVTTNLCGLAAPVIASVSETPAGGAAGQAPNPGATVSLAAAVTDVDNNAAPGCALGQTFGLTWTVVSGPSKVGLTLVSPLAAAPAAVTFVPDQLGTYQLQVSAADSAGLVSNPAFLTFTTTRCGANAPTITSAGVITTPPSTTSATVGSALPKTALPLLAVADDADNAVACGAAQTLTPVWKINQKPAGSNAVIADPTAFSTSFTPDLPGDYQLAVSVTDTTGLSSNPSSVSVHVVACGEASATVAGAAILTTANPGAPGVAKLGYGVTLTAGTIVSNNCLLPVEVQTGSGASFNLSAGSKLDVLVGGVRSSHTFASATTTAASVIASINGDAAISYSARAAGSGIALYSRPPSGAVPPFSLGSELQIVAPVSGTDASVALALPSGQRTTAAALYSWSLSDKPAGSQAVLQPANGATPTFVPDLPGSYVARLVVTNGLGLESDPQFVTVSPIDCATAAPTVFTSVNVGSSVTDPESGSNLNVGGTVQLSAVPGVNFVDANAVACGAARAATPYAYHWALISKPLGSSAVLSAATDATPSFIPDVQGNYTVSFSVSDALGANSGTVFKTFSTSLCGANAPAAPTIALRDASNTSTVTFAQSLHPVTVAGSTTDADDTTSGPNACPARFGTGGNFTFHWSLVSVDAGVSASLSGTTTPAVLLTASTGADATVTVGVTATATKTGLASPQATLQVPVKACGGHAPVITQILTKQGAVTVSRPALNAAVSIQAVVSDADSACAGDTVARYSFTPVSLPGGSGAQITQTTPATDTGSFTPDVAGTYRYSVTATDSTGLTSAPVLVELQTASCAPGLTGTPLTASTVPAGAFKIGQAITVTPGAYAANGCVANSTPVYAWALTQRPAGSAAALTSASAVAPSFTPDVPGVYVAQLTLADNGGNVAAPYSLSISVATCGTASPAPVLCDSGTTLPATSGCAVTNPVKYLANGASVVKPDVGNVVQLSVPAIYDPNADQAVAGACSVAVLPASSPFTWRWSLLQKPAGSLADLSSTTAKTPSLVPDAVGQYQVSVVATDALGFSSAPAILTFSTSTCGANAPVPTILGSGGTLANTSVHLTGSAVDNDNVLAQCPVQFAPLGTPLTLTWSLVSSVPGASVSLVPAPDGSAADFTASRAGTYVVGLTAVDPTGRSGSVLKTLVVDGCGSNLPTITTVLSPASNPPLSSAVNLTATVSDLDNAGPPGCNLAQTFNVTWRLASAPAGSTYSVTGNVSNSGASGVTGDRLAFTANRSGTYSFDVTATDSLGLTSAPFRVNIAAGTVCTPATGSLSILATNNHAPPRGAGVYDVGDPIVFSQNGTLTTPCVADTTFTTAWSVAARPAGSGATINPVTGDLVPDVPGVYTVQETVNDAGGFSTSKQATITVGACQPTVSIAFKAIYPANGNDETATGPFAGDRIDLTPTIGTCGNATPAWTYAWTLVSKPATSGATLGGAASPAASFAADVPSGSWEVALTVSDGLGNTSAPAYQTVTTTSCGGNGPSFGGIPATTTVNTGAVSASIGANAAITHPDAPGGSANCPARFDSSGNPVAFNPVTYTWRVVGGPPGGVLNLSSASTATIKVESDQPGTYDIALIVTDARGVQSAPAPGQVVVDPCGSFAPLATSITATGTGTTQTTTYNANGAANGNVGGPFASRYPIALHAFVSDANVTCAAIASAQISASWTLSPPAGSQAVLLNPQSLTPSFVPDVINQAYLLTLTIADQTGHSRTQSFTTTTSNCGGAAPTLQPIVFTTPATGGLPATLSVLGDDTDNAPAGCNLSQALSYAWSFTSIPAGSTAALATSPITGGSQAVFTPDKTGPYAFAVVLTDSTGLSAVPQTGTINVNQLAAITFAGAAASAKQTAVPTTPTPTDVTQSDAVGQLPPAGNDLYLGFAAQIALTTPPSANDLLQDCATLGCSYQWTLIAAPAGSHAAINGAALASPSFTPDVAGPYQLQLVASFGPRTGSGVFTFRAGSCGGSTPVPVAGVILPTAAPGPFTAVEVPFDAASLPNVSQLVQLTAGGTTDADNGGSCNLAQTVGYTWAMLARPVGSSASLSGATLVNPSFTADKPGDYQLQLTATDSTGRSASTAFTATLVPRAKLTGGNVPGLSFQSLGQDAAGNLYAATLTPASGGEVRVFSCAAPCATGAWVAMGGGGPLATGLGVFSAAPSDDQPRPVALAALPDGSGVFVAFHTLASSPASANDCAIDVAFVTAAAVPALTEVVGALAPCLGDGSTAGEPGRWISLALDPAGPTWVLVWSVANQLAATNCTGACTTGPGPGPSSFLFQGAGTGRISSLAIQPGSALAQGAFSVLNGSSYEAFTFTVAEGNPPVAGAAQISGSASLGRSVSAAVDGAGRLHVATLDVTNGKAVYGSCSGVGCTPALAPVDSSAVAQGGDVGLALDAGGVTVGYLDLANGLLRTARGAGATPASFSPPQWWLADPSTFSLASVAGKTRVVFSAPDLASPANGSVYSLVQ